MISYVHYYRVATYVVALFFFTTCFNKTKTWKFTDIHSLDVRVLDTKEWLVKTKADIESLNKIMLPQLDYYKKKNSRIYQKLDNPYQKIKTEFFNIDSTYKSMSKLLKKMKIKASYSLDDIPKNNSISYRDLFNDSRERIKKSMDSYRKNIKKLKKTFKSTKQVLFFVEEECLEYKNSIYDLQYRRNLGQENIDRFNKKLNKAIFDDTNSSRSMKIIDISKTLESNRLKLDSFENFLTNMEKVLMKELGGSVVLIPKKNMHTQLEERFKTGKNEYIQILKDSRKLIESL